MGCNLSESWQRRSPRSPGPWLRTPRVKRSKPVRVWHPELRASRSTGFKTASAGQSKFKSSGIGVRASRRPCLTHWTCRVLWWRSVWGTPCHGHFFSAYTDEEHVMPRACSTPAEQTSTRHFRSKISPALILLGCTFRCRTKKRGHEIECSFTRTTIDGHAGTNNVQAQCVRMNRICNVRTVFSGSRGRGLTLTPSTVPGVSRSLTRHRLPGKRGVTQQR